MTGRVTYRSPIGDMYYQLNNKDELCALGFGPGDRPSQPDLVSNQLDRYFSRNSYEFDLPIRLVGTDFQLEVWNELQKVPFGETRSYADIARRIGKPDAIRAVGTANGANPIAIIIPCHRIIGSNGSLTGYAGGLDNKKKLLDFEAGVISLF